MEKLQIAFFGAEISDGILSKAFTALKVFYP